MAVEFVSRDAFAGAAFSSSESQVAAVARWSTSGKTFRAKSPSGDLIKIDDAVNRITSRLIAKIGPAVSKAINTRLAPVAQRAFADWPVRTGLSKSKLFYDVTVAGDRRSISAKITNKAPYAFAIRRGKLVKELVFEPSKEAARQMSIDIAKGRAKR